jgi:hypothetical protein
VTQDIALPEQIDPDEPVIRFIQIECPRLRRETTRGP